MSGFVGSAKATSTPSSFRRTGIAASARPTELGKSLAGLGVEILSTGGTASALREAGIEVMYTVIESLTLDGRDMGLDYKISKLFCPKGSRDARVIDAIAPKGDEIVFPKTSSSVFISTNIHYVLGNLGVKHLIVSGLLTDQCIDSTVRDACDYGYLVTLVTDACATLSEERHASSIANNRGYCRQRTTDQMLEELAALG